MTPDSLESRLARVEERLEAAARQTEVFAPTARQALETALKLDDVASDVARTREWITRVEGRLNAKIADVLTACTAIRADYQADQKTRSEARSKIVIAVIAASATVLAAIIVAVGAIVTQG